MADGTNRCPSCDRATRLFTPPTGRASWHWLKRVGQNVWDASQLLVFLVIALSIAYYLSPLLLMFPLAALFCTPPASRGGRTVSRGKRRK